MNAVLRITVLTATALTATPKADPVETFVAGNRAYAAGDHAGAIGHYLSLLEAGSEHPVIHYNLGNAYLRHGELGRAIAAYRRAARGLPRNRDVQANLDLARSRVSDAVEPPEPSPVLSAFFYWQRWLSPSELWAAVIALNALFWTLLAVRLYRRRAALLGWMAAGLLVPLLPLGASLAVAAVTPRDVAVVLPSEVEVRSGARPDATVLFRLHAGSEVSVVDRYEEWLRVSLPEGVQGWIPQRRVEVVPL